MQNMLLASKKIKIFFWIILPFLIFFALAIFFLLKGYAGSATVVGALLGVWLAWRLNQDSLDDRRKNEYRSLLVSFVHELEENYHRCILYHTQRQHGSVSFSAIFDFNDASTLARLASVTDNPKIIDAIMFLKKQYFQVGRHVENASWLATDFDKKIMKIKLKVPNFSFKVKKAKIPTKIRTDVREAGELYDEASRARDRALGFFFGGGDDFITYPKIVDSTALLLKELKEKWADVAEEFKSRFEEDRGKLCDVEKQKKSRK
jgi:hypothetical protein